MGYKIVTIASRIPTESYYTFTEHFTSLRGEGCLILGSNPGEYGGLGSKPRLLYNAIKAGQIPESHIIFSDCFDLVFSCPPKEVFLKYLQFGTPFVISAEKNCFPDTFKTEYDMLPSSGSPYKYLNSGMIVAETEAMLTVLESMDAKNIPNDYWNGQQMINPNDQEYYQKEFLKQPVPMALDTMQILSQTLHEVELDEFDFSEERVRNKTTNSYPCTFHFNGGSKTSGVREPILKHLGL